MLHETARITEESREWETIIPFNFRNRFGTFSLKCTSVEQGVERLRDGLEKLFCGCLVPDNVTQGKILTEISSLDKDFACVIVL